MRIELMDSPYRSTVARVALELVKRRAGVYPGPPVTLTYKPQFLAKEFGHYITRGMNGSGVWTKGEAEMFCAFVSMLNSCRF